MHIKRKREENKRNAGTGNAEGISGVFAFYIKVTLN